MFLGLNAEAYDRAYTDQQLLRRLLSYLTPHRVRVRRTLALVLLITVIGFVQPVVMSRGLDALRKDVLAGTDSATMVSLVGAIAAAMISFAVLNWLGNLVRRRLVSRLVADVIAAIRRDAFDAVIHHDLAFFDKYQSGKIVARITNDTAELSQTAGVITDLAGQFAILIALTVYLFSVSWQLTLILLSMAPVIALLGWLFRKAARWVTRRGFRAIAEVNTAIQEAVAGMRIAKNFRQEAAMYGQFRRVNDQSYGVNLRRGLVLSNIFPALNALSGLGSAIMMYAGAVMAGRGDLGVGSWYLFIISLDLFWFPLTNLASFWSTVQNGLAALERVFALIDTPSTVRQIAPAPAAAQPGAREPGRGDSITFRHVSFRYSSQTQVLDDFNLDIAPGESVAFVGHTGAGKSSLVKLIGRFYEFQTGEILVNGTDIRSVDLTQYRRRMGIVTQSPFLFAGTVTDNIRYARPDMSDEAVATLAGSIGQGDWVHTLPEGLATEVGERGARLSMGQRQLVALARVLAQRPSLFMLDEATASVDPFTERQIQQAINLALSQSTAILIAHRLSTVKAVDRIIVLDQGRVIQEGSHAVLMARGGHYATLYDTYFRHQSAEFRVVM